MYRQYEMIELSYQAQEPPGSWVDVCLTGEFTLGETTVSVKGFYAGDSIYKLRFLPQQAGEWHYRISGIVSDDGVLTVEPAAPGNHGMVQAEGTCFRYEDGVCFSPFGTTVYGLISQTDALIEQTMQTLETAPFNKVRLCVFPKHYDFNHNEPSYYAFEKAEDGSWDPGHPVFAFWDTLERHIERLGSMGIQVDLILFHPYDRWGFNGMGAQKDKTYLDYLLRRLAAYPNLWWSLANEYELCDRSLDDWYDIEEFVAANDPYHHLLSCHNIFRLWDFDRPNTTHLSIQSKSLYRLNEWREKYQKPVVLDECCYEGDIEPLWGSITGKEMVRRFWQAVSAGAYCTHGETFYAEDDVLWWARGGVLKGESAPRIAFCRQIIESLPGHLEGEEGWLTKIGGLMDLDEAEREALIGRMPKQTQLLVRAYLNGGENAIDQSHCELVWYGHIGDEVLLHYHDTRPITRETLKLPEGKSYRIEVLDTWNMTREVVAEHIAGEYIVSLPGREYMAVLATAE